MEVLLGVIVIVGLLVLAFRRGWLPRWYLWLFVLGALIGLLWEIGFTFDGMGYPILPGGAPNPDGMDIDQMPLPIIALMIAMVCIWDGGLFVCGLLLARLACGSRIERQFHWPAFLIMQGFGQAQSFVIEIYAIENGMWAYAAESWNPKLFDWGEAQITLVPQLVWALGYCAFYAGVLALARSRQQPAP